MEVHVGGEAEHGIQTFQLDGPLASFDPFPLRVNSLAIEDVVWRGAEASSNEPEELLELAVTVPQQD